MGRDTQNRVREIQRGVKYMKQIPLEILGKIY